MDFFLFNQIYIFIQTQNITYQKRNCKLFLTVRTSLSQQTPISRPTITWIFLPEYLSCSLNSGFRLSYKSSFGFLSSFHFRMVFVTTLASPVLVSVSGFLQSLNFTTDVPDIVALWPLLNYGTDKSSWNSGKWCESINFWSFTFGTISDTFW